MARELSLEEREGSIQHEVFPPGSSDSPADLDGSFKRASVLRINKKFKIDDGRNYLISLRHGEHAQPCHRPAHIGQEKSVIMLLNRSSYHSPPMDHDTLGDQSKIGDEHTNDQLEGESDLNLYLQERSFVEFSLENTVNEVSEVDKMLLQTLNSIDIKQLENMYTIEEKSYIQFMGKKFQEKWCQVNIGPEVMSSYIAWCKNQGPLSQEMFAVVSRATSERFSRMVESTEEFQDLNIHDKFSLLKSNLKYCDTLTMIRKLSFLNPKDDYFNSWGTEDKVMWDESGMTLQPDTMTNILKEMPFPLNLKQQFISLLVECKLPILSDQHVFSMVVAILIFSSTDIQLVER